MVRSIPRNAGIEIMSTGLSMFSFFLGGGGGVEEGGCRQLCGILPLLKNAFL